MKRLLLLGALWCCGWAQDALTPFVAGVSGNMSIEGPTGFYSNPARLGNRSIFMFCEVLNGKEELGCGGGGEFLLNHQRISFYSSYLQMDSLYRQVYSELDASYHWSFLIAGGAYGYSMEWSPGLAQWSRHRYKGGLSLILGQAYFAGMMSGWVSEFEKTWNGTLGAGIRLSGLGIAYGQWDGKTFLLGNEISWKFLTINTSYQFPEFGVGVGLRFSIGNWNPRGSYGFSSGKWSWLGFGGTKFF